jgi:hypothetical protein
MEEGSDAAVREYVYDRLVFRAACSAAVCAVVAPPLTVLAMRFSGFRHVRQNTGIFPLLPFNALWAAVLGASCGFSEDQATRMSYEETIRKRLPHVRARAFSKRGCDQVKENPSRFVQH